MVDNEKKVKMRIWWIPQLGAQGDPFYIPVESPEEAKKMLTVLAAYDGYQYQNRIKGDYCNTGGVEILDEESGEWEDWYLETEDNYFDDIDDYIEQCAAVQEMNAFSNEVLGQVDWSKMD